MTTRPYFLSSLSGRVARGVAGVEREPIAQQTPDLHGADLLLVAWAALFGACFSTGVLIAIFGGPFVKVLCRG